jgi:predicted Na+-dependent transporter
MSASQTHILQLGWNLSFLLVVMITLHILILFLNFAISKAIRLDRPATTAFTIQTSQKALVVAYLIWLDFFSIDFPMALIPPAAYHLIQIVMDAFIARRRALKALKNESQLH